MDLASTYITAGYGTVNEKTSTYVKVFWTGFVLYSVAYSLTATENVNYFLVQVCQLGAIGLMVLGGRFLIRFDFESHYFKAVFSLYGLWLIMILARGFTLNYEFLKTMLFSAWFGGLLYLVPLFALFAKRLSFYRGVFQVIIVLSLLFAALDVLFIGDLLNPYRGEYAVTGKRIVEVFSKTLAIPAGFILLTLPYHTKKRILIAGGVILLSIAFAAIRARRGLIFMTSLTLVASYIMYFYYSKFHFKFVLILLGIFGLVLINTYVMDYLVKSDALVFLRERLSADTRTGVELRFFQDMTTLDWIIGKGADGMYYCPEVPSPNNSKGYREVIETDFLQVILKGGLISLVLLLLVLLPAAFLGLFRSNNLLAKAAGVWILLAIVNMYPATVNTFTLNYALVWISVGICYSPSIRNLPDEVLKSYFAT